MRIRRLEIQNYRGIDSWVWHIPSDVNFICLIGPGDGAKSTILEAISMALTDRWSLAISDDLAVVRCVDGALQTHMLRDAEETIQPMLRAKPSVFLAGKVVFGEGRTEYGLLRALIAKWDAERSKPGLAPAAALGVAIAHGDGDTHAAQRAIKMLQIGYETAILVDTDNPDATSVIGAAETAGVDVAKWGDSHCIESALCAVLAPEDLAALVQLAIECRAGEATVRDDLRAYHTGDITTLDVDQWMKSGDLDLAGARALIAATAKGRKWFKTIPNGEALGEFVWARMNGLEATPFGANLAHIKQWIYDVTPTAA